MNKFLLACCLLFSTSVLATDGGVINIYSADSSIDYAYGFATKVTRTSGHWNQFTVAGQFNAWADYGAQAAAFGIAAEAVAMYGSDAQLIGAEMLVGNLWPGNRNWKIANDAVFVNKVWNGPVSSTKNNVNSIAYRVSATPGTGFETAFKLEKDSISDSDQRQASVIDLSDLENLDVVVFKLPQGKTITLRQLMTLAK